MKDRLAIAVAMLWIVSMPIVGCGDEVERQWPTGSALWIGASSRALTTAEMERLGSEDIGHLFVELGELVVAGEAASLSTREWPALPRQASAMLVVVGDRPLPEDGLEGIASELSALRTEAEARGVRPLGVHLDLPVLEDEDALVAYGDRLAELRDRVAADLLLSATVPREVLASPHAESMVRDVDLVVAFLYGERKPLRDAPQWWDFQLVERDLARLEELGTPYLLGVVTSASVYVEGRVPEDPGRARARSLKEWLTAAPFTLEHGFVLEGVDRQVYSFRVVRETSLGGERVRRGHRVRVVGTSAPHLEELFRLIGAWSDEHRLGYLFCCLPASSDRLSLGPEQIVDAMAPEAALPRPEIFVEVLGRRGPRWRIRVRVVNRSAEPSDVSLVESNFAEVAFADGSFVTVEPGEFRRYDLLRRQTGTEAVRTLRDPNILRLYTALLAGGETVTSGPIVLRARRGSPRLELGGRFIAPYGQIVTLDPRTIVLGQGGEAP